MAVSATATVGLKGIQPTSEATNKSYLQPTGFKFKINRKYFANLEFFAQSVLHPATTVQSVEVGIPRIATMPLPGDKLTMGEVTAMIILDEDLSGYTELYNWMKSFVEVPDTSNVDAQNMGRGASSADITCTILSSHNNKNKTITYHDAVPTSLGDIAFEAASGTVQYVIYPASFRFTYFTIK
ncbi:MAG: hypothetical protein CBB96_05510 [Gammaproteobacteria bacterium TMED36]|nr:MAG: hypothetical protein CBB96_08970 [Gammaproteobacteria bacterium TMED36]OUT94620.1 MAG: hypothetical protein CBB96_05510 [Gammaproteobacteria bacterium TMED36]|tara:strand:+ start:5092 stop:5640 length:549 start_codon:yes stop_codon:yes gene_type:complete